MRQRRLRPFRELASALRRLLPDPLVVALRLSARWGDVRSTWRAANRLIRRRASPEGTARWDASPGLRALDQAVFGHPGVRPPPDLKRAARDALSAQIRETG